MFEALKTWFERRQVLAELRVAVKHENAGFSKYLQDQIVLAGECYDSGDHEKE